MASKIAILKKGKEGRMVNLLRLLRSAVRAHQRMHRNRLLCTGYCHAVWARLYMVFASLWLPSCVQSPTSGTRYGEEIKGVVVHSNVVQAENSRTVSMSFAFRTFVVSTDEVDIIKIRDAEGNDLASPEKVTDVVKRAEGHQLFVDLPSEESGTYQAVFHRGSLAQADDFFALLQDSETIIHITEEFVLSAVDSDTQDGTQEAGQDAGQDVGQVDSDTQDDTQDAGQDVGQVDSDTQDDTQDAGQDVGQVDSDTQDGTQDAGQEVGQDVGQVDSDTQDDTQEAGQDVGQGDSTPKTPTLRLEQSLHQQPIEWAILPETDVAVITLFWDSQLAKDRTDVSKIKVMQYMRGGYSIEIEQKSYELEIEGQSLSFTLAEDLLEWEESNHYYITLEEGALASTQGVINRDIKSPQVTLDLKTPRLLESIINDAGVLQLKFSESIAFNADEIYRMKIENTEFVVELGYALSATDEELTDTIQLRRQDGDSFAAGTKFIEFFFPEGAIYDLSPLKLSVPNLNAMYVYPIQWQDEPIFYHVMFQEEDYVLTFDFSALLLDSYQTVKDVYVTKSIDSEGNVLSDRALAEKISVFDRRGRIDQEQNLVESASIFEGDLHIKIREDYDIHIQDSSIDLLIEIDEGTLSDLWGAGDFSRLYEEDTYLLPVRLSQELWE